MTHFSEEEGSCRVDIFKKSGKWYETVAIDMRISYNHNDLHEAVLNCLEKRKPGVTRSILEGEVMAICSEPYHKFSHPIMLKRNI